MDGATTQHKGLGVPDRIIDRLRDTISVERVFGEPIERDGATVVPVAALRAGGGGGGGGGNDFKTSGSGEGGGFGATARPVGVYVIDRENVTFKPALDWTRMFVVANVTTVAYFLFTWLAGRKRTKHR
jgi:uncharacterized spore protein YtfJ